jgi:hypothetical protein
LRRSPARGHPRTRSRSTRSWPAPRFAALRGGGYVLFFRHAATDFGQNDDKMTGYEDCWTQRNLTDKGRADARDRNRPARARVP